MPPRAQPIPEAPGQLRSSKLQRSLKRKLVFGLAALAVVAFAGGAYAATQSSAPNTRQAFLNDVAKRLGVTPQQLTAALDGATKDQLQAAVKSGRLTQAQANALAQGLKQNGAGPQLPFGFGFGRHFARPVVPGGPAGPGGFGGRFIIPPFGGFGDMPAAASYLGLTDAQLFQQLKSGKSLAQIATAKGKTASGLEQAMTKAMKTRLDRLVANKTITSAQEQKILSRFSAIVSTVVNQKGEPFPHPGLRFRNGVAPAPGAVPKMPNMLVPPAYALPPALPAPTA
jgi:hypothetical protein